MKQKERPRNACRSILAVMLAAMLAGCAGVSYTTITGPVEDAKARGFRYYDTSPYILVTTDNAGGLSSQIKYMPDTTKKRSARPYAFLAKNDTTLTFGGEGDAGLTLTQGTTNSDSTEVPNAVLTALADVAKQAITSGVMDRKKADGTTQPDKRPAKAPTFALFKVVKRNGEWGLIGARNNPVGYKE